MASRGINKVILVGNLGQDPEVRYTANQSAVANVRIATSESWKDKATGEQKEQTEWHSVVFFGRLAEIVSEYLNKGSQIYVEGRLRTRKWQDKEGQDRYTTEIVADEMQMLGGRGGGSGGGMERGGDTPARSAPSRSPAPAGGSKPAAAVEDFDDDIPF